MLMAKHYMYTAYVRCALFPFHRPPFWLRCRVRRFGAKLKSIRDGTDGTVPTGRYRRSIHETCIFANCARALCLSIHRLCDHEMSWIM